MKEKTVLARFRTTTCQKAEQSVSRLLLKNKSEVAVCGASEKRGRIQSLNRTVPSEYSSLIALQISASTCAVCPPAWSSITAMPLIDADTREIIMQKTWCHGQAVCPVYGIVILWWYVDNGLRPIALIFPGFFLPYWCYLSYRSIFINFDYRKILIGGLLAEVSHGIVFFVAIKHLEKTMHMIIFVTSLLFFIETAAFLGVVTAFQPQRGPDDNTEPVTITTSYETTSLLV